ncbi:MAG TPA: T9SS type A sorting domain-containing protein [Ignavibacteria bacterium]|nr:T9SS type A sorting domain-containing protein [Ignavibacteria bacterium]
MKNFLKLFFVVLLLGGFYSHSSAQQKNSSLFPGKLESTVNPIPFLDQGSINNGFETDQVNVNVITGTATSGNSRAPQGSQRYIRTVYYISPAEMQASGFPVSDVNLIGFYYSVAQSITTTGDFRVYLQNTNDLAYSKPSNVWTNGTNGIIDNMTLVHNDPITIPTTVGNFDIPFVNGSTFTYNGGGLYIAFEYINASNPLSTSNTAWCNTAIANGLKNAFSTTTLPTSVGAAFSAFRPYTRLGNGLIDVVEVVQLYTLGKSPLPAGNPNKISALVRNNSGSPISFNADLSIFRASDGTVRHTDMVSVVDLGAGATQLLNFTDFNASVIEVDSVLVSIAPLPGETYVTNNSKKNVLDINSNSFTYAQGTTPSGGVGFTGATGDFVARFTTSSKPSVLNQINVNFSTGGNTLQVGVWNANGPGGTPGDTIWNSQPFVSTPGVFTVLISPPVVLGAGDFFVGVRQTGTINASFSYQTESPIRANTFFFASPTGSTTWNDFAPANPFRFMIEPRFALNNDVGAASIGQSGVSYVSGPVPMTGSVSNYGILPNSFNVVRKIYDNLGLLVYNQSTSVTGLIGSSSANTTFPDFTGYTFGVTYTIVDSTTLATDQNVDNNRFQTTFTPIEGKNMAIVWFDAASRDSLIAQLDARGYQNDYNIVAGTGYTGSFSSWRTVFYLLADFVNWTGAHRDSMKTWLDASTSGPTKKTLLIFGNDLGWFNDPGRNVTAPPADTLFYRQYLRGRYILDDWIADLPSAGSSFYGTGLFSSITQDSIAGPFPDLVMPARWNDPNGYITSQFLPLATTTGDSSIGIAYGSMASSYNLFYGTNLYSNYRTRIGGTLDNPIDVFDALANWTNANDGALPVELLSFTATANRNNVDLRWTTATETNNSGFEVERKLASENDWRRVASVEGHGNSNEPKQYSLTDMNLQTGKYNYRLKQIDYNGNFEYHNLTGEIIVGVPEKFDLSQNYPNPFNPVTKINYELPIDGKVTMKIFDITGREVAKLVNEIKPAGYYTVQFNAGAFASGVYFYQIYANGINGKDFLMTKKMMLIK